MRGIGEEERELVDAPRRGLLGLLAAAPLGLLLAGTATGQAPATCPGMDANAGMRRTLNFKPVSPDPKKTCALCAFYAAGTAGCGKCQLLSGGGVAAGSVCDNFAPKG